MFEILALCSNTDTRVVPLFVDSSDDNVLLQTHRDLTNRFSNSSTLNNEHLSNCRPIFNLPLISKITERVVKYRLTCHLSSNNLPNPHQSAYCKHLFTETALLYVHDHLINTIGSQRVSCLCLLDLSAT